MEPVTHFLTGACIGRAGLNRRTAYATLAATLAAEAPDLDTLWAVAGPVASFQHHRGITHTFVAAPFMAAIVTGFVWVLDRFVFTRIQRKREAQPVRWLWVWLAALIAHLSHLLLDWTNNYGLRPFFPFNPRWYAGSFVFIAEPVLWALLVGALVFPWLLGLADREVGARRSQFRGRGWAIFALAGMVVFWCWRWTEHAEAINLVEAAQVVPFSLTPVTRVAAEPYPVNPWRWHALLETASSWQTAEVDTRTGAVQSNARADALFKPQDTPSLEAAKRTQLGRVYLDWSQWPAVRDLGPMTAPGQAPPDFPAGRKWSTVEFSDLRFAYNFLDTGMAANQPLDPALTRSRLSGWVYILGGQEEAGEFLDGKEQK